MSTKTGTSQLKAQPLRKSGLFEKETSLPPIFKETGYISANSSILAKKPVKTKEIIDEIYRKEKKYVKQYVREDFIANYSNIFDLNKAQNVNM